MSEGAAAFLNKNDADNELVSTVRQLLESAVKKRSE
jgi:hypothetical protein